MTIWTVAGESCHPYRFGRILRGRRFGEEHFVRKLLFAAFLALLSVAPASATLRIEASPGGRIGDYLMLFALVRQTGQQVIIDGPCLSACTLVLSMVPRERICVTRRAILGFHAAWTPDGNGRPLTHSEATRLMIGTYPRAVRSWIARRGGLSRRILLLRGNELAALYPRCG
jgi:hypothetical protein